jgi:protein-disulfide isomerase
MQKYIILFFLLFVLIIVGCEGVDVSQISDEDLERISEKAVVCNAPYIRFGTSCCLDQNSNEICDQDELDKPEEPEKIVPESPTPDIPAPGEPTEPGEKISVKDGDNPILGSEDAPVVMIEFCDFQGPFCKRHFDQVFPLLKEDYIDENKLKFVYRHFPLSFHPQAQIAAEASECADEQGKFWEYHDDLFINQNELGRDLYMKIAQVHSLDEYEFIKCIDSQKYKQEVVNDFSYGQQVGVSGTPTFFINGVKLVGAQQYDAFKQIIDEELKN